MLTLVPRYRFANALAVAGKGEAFVNIKTGIDS
jgi:hypothetical protein